MFLLESRLASLREISQGKEEIQGDDVMKLRTQIQPSLSAFWQVVGPADIFPVSDQLNALFKPVRWWITKDSSYILSKWVCGAEKGEKCAVLRC